MNNNTPRHLAFAAVMLGGAALVQAHEGFDISPRLEAGKIVTGGVTHTTSVNPVSEIDYAPDEYNFSTPSWRVYGFEFGEDPDYPTFVQDPGVNNEPGTYRNAHTLTDFTVTGGSGLPLGSSLSLKITSDLSLWNGSGFSPVPANEGIRLTNGGFPAITANASSGVSQPSIKLKTFTVNDQIHLHLGSQLVSPSDVNPELGLSGGAVYGATDGVYMFSAIFTSTDLGVDSSDPIWLVFNYNNEAEHEAAIEWVDAHLVPEPASMGLLLVGAVWAVKGRGRNRRNR